MVKSQEHKSGQTIAGWYEKQLSRPVYITILLTLILACTTFYFQSAKFVEGQEVIARNLSNSFSLAIMQHNRLLLETTSGLAINSQRFDQICVLEGSQVVYSLPTIPGRKCTEVPETLFSKQYAVPLASTPQYRVLYRFPRFYIPVGSIGFILIAVLLIALIVYSMLRLKKKIILDIISPLQTNIEKIKNTQSKSLKVSLSGISEINDLFYSFADKIKQVQDLSEKDIIQTKNYERNKAIAETTQMIAHDLKGPLAVFQKVSYGNEIDFKNEQSNMRKALNRVVSMADSIKAADIEGIIKPVKSDLDLTEIISNLNSLADEKKIEIGDHSHILYGLFLDLPKTERAISNLLINAIEAAHAKVGVSVRLYGTSLDIRITDDGEGVPEEIRTKLFRQGATFGKEGGSGLGLAFVKHVALGHGGGVSYKRKGSASIFTMRLENVRVPGSDQVINNARPSRDTFAQDSEKVSSNILIKIQNSDLETRVIEELSTRYPHFKISSNLSDIGSSNLIYGDDPDLLVKDLPKTAKLMITSTSESFDKILNRIEKGLSL